MRELTLLETGFLCGLLLFSLVLPILMSMSGPEVPAARRICMRLVWIGQGIGAAAGLAILSSGAIAPYVFEFAATAIVVCAFLLRRQLPLSLPEPG